MKKIISLHGSYFYNNYGDTLLVNLFASWIKEALPDSEINLPIANRRKIWEMPGEKSGIINLCKSHALVFCGGGYFGEQPRHKYRWAVRNFLRHGVVGLLAILFRIPIAIIGVEFGPISASWFRKVVIFIAKHADVIVVRNQESLDFLSRHGVSGVELSYDAVLSLSDIILPKELSYDNPTIALHLPNIQFYPQQYLNLVRLIIRQAKIKFASFKIILINDGSYNVYNRKPYEDVLRLLETEKVHFEMPAYTGCYSFANLINDCNYLITTQLHVGITGAALNKRVLSCYTHPKTIRLHKQIGNEYFCEPISGISSKTELKIKEFFNSKPYVLPTMVKENALKNKYILRDFIEKINR